MPDSYQQIQAMSTSPSRTRKAPESFLGIWGGGNNRIIMAATTLSTALFD